MKAFVDASLFGLVDSFPFEVLPFVLVATIPKRASIRSSSTLKI
jgi:hypothetical protein